MSEYVVSVDAGNGVVNGFRALKRQPRSITFPSVRAAATGDTLGLDDFEVNYNYVDWEGRRFVYGDEVYLSQRAIEQHQGSDRYGNEFHRFLVAVATGLLGVKKGIVDVTLFAPPGLFTKVRPVIAQAFEEQAQATIQFKGDSQPRSWRYRSVSIFPEGLGAALCFALDEQGRPQDNNVLDGHTVILDMGMRTLDVIQMHDGNFNPESLQTSTFEEGGLRQHVLQPLLRETKNRGRDFSYLKLHHIEKVMRTGIQTGDYTLRVAGKQVDLKPEITALAVDFANWIANNVIDDTPALRGLAGIKSAILVGGGATLVDTTLRDWYDERIVRFDAHESTANVQPVEANAIGGLRLAQMKAAQKA